MERWTISSRTIVLGIVLMSMVGCALWFVPESRGRGHIFDEATREGIQGRTQGELGNLDRVIHQTFPLGTPVVDVVEHIKGAGGVCIGPTGGEVTPGQGATTCTYGSTNYFARAYMGMGEPTFLRAQNEWTVLIHHSDGVTTEYVVENKADFEFLSREDYMEGVDRQGEQEEELQRKNTEN